MDGKRTFIMYADLIHTVKKMPEDKAGKFFLTILEYVNDLNPEPEDLLVQIAFEPVKQQLKRDLIKWEVFHNKQSENGKKGGRPKNPKPKTKKPKNPSLLEESQKSLSVSVNVNDIVNDKKDIADKSAYVQCIEIYNQFINKQTGCDAIIDGLQGKSLNTVIDYFTKNIKKQPATKESIVSAVKYIFDNYEKWSEFHKKGLRLNQISSELINIIHDIRSFKAKPINKD